MFIGAAGGIALSHVGGLPMIAGAAMGVGAMVAGALKMPMTAVLLPSLLFLSDAVNLMPVVIVAVVVSYVVAVWIKPNPSPVDATAPAGSCNQWLRSPGKGPTGFRSTVSRSTRRSSSNNGMPRRSLMRRRDCLRIGVDVLVDHAIAAEPLDRQSSKG